MESKHIINFEQLISTVLLDGKKFVSYSAKNLTKVGDNYASLMLSVDVTIKNEKNNTEEDLHLVAKMYPTSEVVATLFNTPVTFKNEVGFYKTISPAMQKFQKLQGFNTFFDHYPELITERFSLNNNAAEVDKNAVLLLKNIKFDGYVNVTKTVGFDLITAKLVLEKIAQFHAIIIAMRDLEPGLYEENVAPFLDEYKIFDVDKKDNTNEYFEDFIKPIADDLQCIAVLDKLKAMLTKFNLSKNTKKDQVGKFLTVIHRDLWITNIMIKFDEGKPVDVKFVDFQLYEYNSVLVDVLFFLMLSVNMEVVKSYLDELLLFYYDNFIGFLAKLGYKNVDYFGYDDFLDEIPVVMKRTVFIQVYFMMRPLFSSKEDTKQLDDIQLDDFSLSNHVISKAHKEKAVFLVHECLKRNWI